MSKRKHMPSRRTVLGCAAGFALATEFAAIGSAAGAFKDPLMKLFVVSELMRRKRIDLGPPDAFFQRLLGRPHDTRIDGYRAHPKALDYFAQLALSADDLAAVEQLDLDGGNPIFRYVDPNWQGYTDGIDAVTRLDDIVLFPNLAIFSNSAFLTEKATLSFAPFRGLSRLRTIDASFENYADLDAFLSLPALSVCRVLSNQVYTDVMTHGHPTRRVMETLRARGVKVRVHWISRSGPPFE
jgi:Family of unknown function (DUF6892)